MPQDQFKLTWDLFKDVLLNPSLGYRLDYSVVALLSQEYEPSESKGMKIGFINGLGVSVYRMKERSEDNELNESAI